MSRGDIATATEKVARLRKAVAGVRIDATFVRRKLERMQRLANHTRLGRSQHERTKKLFGAVHREFFAGNYVQANSRLALISRVVLSSKN